MEWNELHVFDSILFQILQLEAILYLSLALKNFNLHVGIPNPTSKLFC